MVETLFLWITMIQDLFQVLEETLSLWWWMAAPLYLAKFTMVKTPTQGEFN
jgi:hypothetical protein